MPESTRDDRSLERHTGANALLKFDDGGGYKEIPVTDVSWTRDYSVEEVQHSGSMKPTLATTEIRFNGSFEYQGQNPEVLQAINVSEEGGPIEHNRPVRGTLTIKEFNHDDNDQEEVTITFKRVISTGVDRESPSDDVSSVSVDWEAEDMMVINH